MNKTENIAGNQLLLLAPSDTVLVALSRLDPGALRVSDGTLLEVAESVSMGHKIARHPIAKHEKIIKYGVSIGSARRDIAAGEHVHVHNMQSDYTPTYVLEETAEGDEK